MINLVLATLLTASFFLYFKYFAILKIKTFQALVVNYFTCVVVGYIFSGGVPSAMFRVEGIWYFYAVVLGTLFISIFFLMAKTAQEVSVSVSSVASKMSMIIPSILSLVLVNEVRQNFSWVNVGILVASLTAVFLVTYKGSGLSVKNKWKAFLLVGIVFLGSGLIDTILNLLSIEFPDEYFTSNFRSSELNPDQFKKVFPLFCFAVAFLMGSMRLLFLREKIEWKSMVAGVALGVPNYFSIYFLQASLSDFKGNGAFVFPVINIGIILITSGMAFLLFKERLSLINFVGILIAVGALSLVVIS